MKLYPSASVIEAIQWTGDNLKEVREFITAEWLHPFVIGKDRHCCIDNPSGGVIAATVGDWIIKDPGEMYRIGKEDAFAAYTSVTA